MARTEWIQNQAQWHPPSGQAGSFGTEKSVLRYQTQVWLTEKMVKSSGWRAFTSDWYAIASAQPLTSSMPVVWKAERGAPGQGELLPYPTSPLIIKM